MRGITRIKKMLQGKSINALYIRGSQKFPDCDAIMDLIFCCGALAISKDTIKLSFSI